MNMNKKSRILLITLLFIFTLSSFASAQYYPNSYNNNYNYQQEDYNNYNNGAQSVILNDFQVYAASQKESQWCWAACITMILNYYDLPCTQEEVVTNTYGMLVNSPAQDMRQIAEYLNGWGKTNYGKEVMVQAEAYDSVSFQGVIEELQMGKPFIIGVGDGYSGHVVVCYGVDWIDSYDGPYVQNFYVYDPWPGNGNRVWTTEELNNYWMGAVGVDVQDTAYCNNNPDYSYNNQNYNQNYNNQDYYNQDYNNQNYNNQNYNNQDYCNQDYQNYYNQDSYNTPNYDDNTPGYNYNYNTPDYNYNQSYELY